MRAARPRCAAAFVCAALALNGVQTLQAQTAPAQTAQAQTAPAQTGQAQTGFGTSNGLSLPDIPVLTIEPDRLFAGTLFGQRLTSDLEVRGTRLAAENRRIEAELAQEESELTARRPGMEPAEFRALADDFDARVQRVRSEQDEKARFLTQSSDAAQRQFLQAIAPILETLMIEQGASVILDRRAVFLSADASDVTDAAIARIDAILGDGVNPVAPKGTGETDGAEQIGQMGGAAGGDPQTAPAAPDDAAGPAQD